VAISKVFNRIAITAIAASFAFAAGADLTARAQASQVQVSEVEAARKLSESNPSDAKLLFQYAEALRKAGQKSKAASEYLHVTELDASYFIAYHHLAKCSTNNQLLSEGVRRLKHLMEQKPDDLMLRVALSELLEAKGDFYEATRPLVKLVYSNKVPAKYVNKLQSRIRFLQANARAKHVATKAQETSEKMEKAPIPLPDESLRRGLEEARLESNTISDGFGHSRLQH